LKLSLFSRCIKRCVTIPDDGLIQRGNAEDIYAQLQDLEAAKITAQQGGIGLADLMMQQLMK
jgi:flagellar protein FlgJ